MSIGSLQWTGLILIREVTDQHREIIPKLDFSRLVVVVVYSKIEYSYSS